MKLAETLENRPLPARWQDITDAANLEVKKSTRVRQRVPDRNRNGQYSAIVGCCPTCGAGLKNQQMQVDLDTNTFLIRGQCVYLRAKEAELLSVLVDRAPAVVTHGTLTERLWGASEPGDARKNIEVHVCRLRRALAPVGCSIINVFDTGYKFEAGSKA